MRQKFIIDGARFDTLDDFFCEVDAVFTKDLTFKTGHNLDAYNDILRGGFGRHERGEPIAILWKNAAKSRLDFGYPATAKYYEENINICHPVNRDIVRKKMHAALNETGPTLMDRIIEITLASNNSGHDCTLEFEE
ncbi:barstar family protein [Desulfovibrio sp.]|uniref:barstar family protein n=1 Tax=Desulfovibrio sp. TaxID=885 RepID=UPI002D23C2F1|nr:barstar family protein [Desulfovibrio sp.]HZF61661.1 barstar family protein [Desulfovibrio sp.]